MTGEAPDFTPKLPQRAEINQSQLPSSLREGVVEERLLYVLLHLKRQKQRICRNYLTLYPFTEHRIDMLHPFDLRASFVCIL
jgi:hypothetical protein